MVGTIGGVALDPAPEVVLALHACDTATDEALAQAVELGRPAGAGRAVLPPRHRRPAAQGADARAVRDAHPARHPPRAARGHPDRRAARVADAAAGLPRRRRAVRREPAHPAQHDAARGPHRRPGQGRLGAQGVRRAGHDLGARGPSSPSCSTPDARPVARAGVALSRSSIGTAAAPAASAVVGRPDLPGPGDRRVQRAGRRDGLFLTTNDSGDGGRVFVVDGSRARPSVSTSWAADPEDVEALAPAGAGLGVGRRHRRQPAPRDSITGAAGAVRPRRPGGRRRRRTSWSTRTGPHDAETLLAHPQTGQLFVVSKDIFGGAVYAAPRELVRRRAQPARARSPTGLGFATDGSFFPDGRHYVRARLHERDASTPSPATSGSARSGCRSSSRVRGSRSTSRRRCYLSTEGQFTDVLSDAGCRGRCSAAMEPGTPDADVAPSRPTPPSRSHGVRRRRRSWPWLLGGAVWPGLSRSAGGYSSGVVRLRRTSPDQPGWTRRRAGRGFVYLDEHGDRLPEDGRRSGCATW